MNFGYEVYLTFYHSIHLISSLPIYLSACLSSFYLSIHPSIYLSLSPSIYSFTSLSFYLAPYPSIHPSIYLSTSLYLYLSISVSIFISICIHPSFYRSIYLRGSNRARLLSEVEVDRSKSKQFCETSSKIRSWRHQKRSSSARLPKTKNWLQSWRPRINVFCHFDLLGIKTRQCSSPNRYSAPIAPKICEMNCLKYWVKLVASSCICSTRPKMAVGAVSRVSIAAFGWTSTFLAAWIQSTPIGFLSVSARHYSEFCLCRYSTSYVGPPR